MSRSRPQRPALSLLAIIGIAVAACGGGGAPDLTFPPAAPAAPASADPSPTATASASASATPTASATATAPTPSSSPGQGTAVDPRTDGLDVAFGEYAITLEAAAIRPGAVTFIVHNAGKLVHGLEIKADSSGGGDDRLKIETREFRSGETLRVEADLPPGIYEVECFVGNHDELGMKTSLEVRADAPLVTPSTGAGAPGTVRIVQFAFVAASIDVPAGTSVTWTNDDPAPHTVTSQDGAFDSKQLDPGADFSVVLATPGTYRYLCEIHPTMAGTVVVH